MYSHGMHRLALLLVTLPAAAQITGTRIGIIDDYAARKSYAFYGDTRQPTAWLSTGKFTFNGASIKGSLVSHVNDGGRNWLADSPSCEGNVFLTRITDIDFRKNTAVEEKLTCLSGRYDQAWDPAPPGTCTKGNRNDCYWKSRSPFSIDGRLYLFIYRQEGPANYYSGDATLIMSADGGATWTNPAHVGASKRGDGDYPSGPGGPDYPAAIMWPQSFPAPNRLGHAMIVQMCQDGSIDCPAGPAVQGCDPARYACFWVESGDWRASFLGRVSRANLPHLRASEWEYFQGGDGTRDDRWAGGAAGLASAAPLKGAGTLSNMVYLKDLGVYYMTAWGAHKIDHAWAPHPWGPWTEFLGEDFPWAEMGTFPTPILATAKVTSKDPVRVQIVVAATRYDHNDYHAGGTMTYLLMELSKAR